MSGRKWFWTPEQDEHLRTNYDPNVKGRAQALATALSVPRWVVTHRAVFLGVARIKEPYWTPEEEEYVGKNYARSALKAMHRKLGRSEGAIRLKAKRLGYRKMGEGYTLSSLAQALGVDPHWVGNRVRSGALKATHRHSKRLPQQGGDAYYITDQAVVDFIRNHPMDIDLRKVDRLWFIEVMLGAPNGRAAPENHS